MLPVGVGGEGSDRRSCACHGRDAVVTQPPDGVVRWLGVQDRQRTFSLMTVPTFALHELGWHAFQQLCHTVLREVLGQSVVAFLGGNDGGRDGAFTGRWKRDRSSELRGEFVVQCKHTSRRDHSIAPSDLEDELDKAARLADRGRCDVYVLMTNAGVSGPIEAWLRSELQGRGVAHVLVLGATWLNQTIAENSRLRRLVPRLYGLGDLTQILDERAYRQARAVLDAMRADLAKLVLTGTYVDAANALGEHGLVLLLGAAATGKTTIAAQLALGAADEFSTSVVKLDTVSELKDHWNPDEPQLFWLDDAFGATQFERSLAREWTLAIPRMAGAVHAGAKFVVTSRDYVFQAAYRYLKPGAFPLLDDAQVIVDVSDLTAEERRQILYNHLRHGRQPNQFVAALQPHLEMAADHPGFSPELARRLSEPVFTANLGRPSEATVGDFFARPAQFLHDVMRGLDNDALAALGLIFINRNWLRSPLAVDETEQDLIDRFGGTLGGVIQALDSLEGSLTKAIIRDGQSGWEFTHPTMVDAYAELMRHPDFFHHFLAGFPLATLLGEVTCGDLGWKHATVVDPKHYSLILERLEEPLPGGSQGWWWARRQRTTFLATRCDREFLVRWLNNCHLDFIAPFIEPGLMLEADPDNELIARLNELGLLPEITRAEFARQLIDYCVSGVDPAVLWNVQLRAILNSEEQATLDHRVRTELLTDLPGAIARCTQGWDHGGPDDREPESAVEPLRSLVHHLSRSHPNAQRVRDAVATLDALLDQWVADHATEDQEDADVEPAPIQHQSAAAAPIEPPTRSMFDDLLSGREAGP